MEWDYPLCVMGAIFTVRIFADTDQPVLALMSLSRRQTSSHTCPATRKSVCITNISGMVKINGTAREPVVSALRLIRQRLNTELLHCLLCLMDFMYIARQLCLAIPDTQKLCLTENHHKIAHEDI